MGRRRKGASFGIATKPKTKVPTRFDCPFCGTGEAVRCQINRDKGVGIVECDVCHESFTAHVTALSEPVDVYSEWIDACEEAN